MLKSLLGRSDSKIQVRRILVGTDRSETAERAVTWAADMAARYEAELVLVQVLRDENAGAKEQTRTEAEVVSVMEEELGVPWEDVFESIEPEPLAAGTIAQVHRARLESGEDVLVKGQRPTA